MKKEHFLIIGGTKGIGRALVRTFAGKSRVISVIGRASISEEDKNLPGVRYWSVDLTDKQRLLVVLSDILNKSGKLSHLVFLQRYRDGGDDWLGEIEVSLTATKEIIEHLADEFSGNDENSIVIVGSIADRLVFEEQPVSYHVAKAGLNQMARYFAVALGPKGIRVNCVLPGTVLKDESKDFYLRNEEIHNLYKKIIPLGRMGTSEEVAGVIDFLCSKAGAFVTGQSIIVDGGLSLQGHESLARRLSSLNHLKVTR